MEGAGLMDETEEPKEVRGWMSDVQRAIALILIGSIAYCTALSTSMLVFAAEPNDALVDMSKTMQAALVNMSLIALGFFFGSSMSKQRADIGQQKIMDKLTSPPANSTGTSEVITTVPAVEGPVDTITTVTKEKKDD